MLSDEEECSTQLIGCNQNNKFSFGINEDENGDGQSISNETVSK